MGLRRTAALRVVALAAGGAMQLVAFVLLARQIGPELYGQFGLVFSVGSIVAIVVGLGLAPRVLRLKAEVDGQRTSRAIVTARLLTSALLLAVLAGWSLVRGLDPDVVAIACFAAVAVSLEQVNEIVQAALAGRENLALGSVLLLSLRLGMLVSVLLTPVSFWVAAATYLGWASVVLGLGLVRLGVGRLDREQVGRAVWDSRGFYTANLASSISQWEVPLIFASAGSVAAGGYAVGQRFVTPLNLVTTAVIQVLVPRMASSAPDERWRLFVQARRVSVGLAVLLSATAPLVAWLAVTFLGTEYRHAFWPITGFSVAGLLMGVNQVHQSYLFAVDRPFLSARCIAVGAVTAIVFLAATLLLGAADARSATPVVAQLVMLVGFVGATRRVGPGPGQ